ncbi:MAG: TetR/AcrR family transcriptional regulator [Planctomycetota bacterium]|jgi:AcrR family transcriptional regulator|nr:TetR/AcrR family transcriptional regulator [Planctomycetota bacterium]
MSGNSDFSSFDIFGHSYPLPYDRESNQTKDRILFEATLLFAVKGYASVTIRDIAVKVGITPGALYNHFGGKKAIWNAVLDHAERLYRLYHEHLLKEIDKVGDFNLKLLTAFREPAMMRNLFGCYAFGLVQAEQFRDRRAGELYNRVFIKYTVDFHKEWFDSCVKQGLADPFDTASTAMLFAISAMTAINLKVQESLGRNIHVDIGEMMESLRLIILRLAGR